jgi:replicative DNA helicase
MGTNYNIERPDATQGAILCALYTNPHIWEEVVPHAPAYLFTGTYRRLADLLYSHLESTGGIFNFPDFQLEAQNEGIAPSVTVSVFDYAAEGDPLDFAARLRETYLKTQAAALMEDAKARISQGNDPEQVIQSVTADLELLRDAGTPAKEGIRLQQIQSARDALYTPQPYDSTGFEKLDDFIAGWMPGHFWIIAARAGMGKTTFMLDLIKAYNADGNKPVCLFSLEMGSENLYTKLACKSAGVNHATIIKRICIKYDIENVDRELIKIYDRHIKIYSMPETSGTLTDIVAKIKMMHKQAGVKLVFIDYLQLINADQAKNEIREQVVARIARTLKTLASSLKITIVALSQLSRAVEARGGAKRPQMADLRESGALEQDADGIILPYRPEYYGILEDAEGNSLKGLTEIIIAKNRDGQELGSFMLQYYPGDTYLAPLAYTPAIPAGQVPGEDADIPF